MKKVKLGLSLLLVMTMLFLAACGNDSNNAGSTNSGSRNSGEEASLEPMSLRLASGDAHPQWANMHSDSGKFTQEKTRTTIEQEIHDSGYGADKLEVMDASAVLP